MTELELFKPFAKASPIRQKARNHAVIYTRVSTKEQADTNQSLETQLRYCEGYAGKNSHPVEAYFGGTYESAQTDERKEFNRMLAFVRKHKDKIGYIIVYSVDRFSRSGANAIFIASELKKLGIGIISVTQPTDTSTANGELQQQIQFIFSNYDNNLRREKCIAGIIESLRKGYWPRSAPLGYDQVTIKGQQHITVNKTGEKIRKGFYWKADGVSNTEIQQRLKALGFHVSMQRLTDMFRNPFYCGLITDKLLNGDIIEGKHEALISKEVFLKVNQVNATNPRNYSNYTQKKEDARFPLKKFVYCGSCGTRLTGYIVKKKNIDYYKCNKIGCRCNKSAKQMHKTYTDFLKNYSISGNQIEPLIEVLAYKYDIATEGSRDTISQLKTRLTEVHKDMEKLKRKRAFEDLEKDLYEQFMQELKEDEGKILEDLEKFEIKLSNPEKYYDYTVKMVLKTHETWVSGTYQQRQRLQYIMFPEGIYYDREKGVYRTNRVNEVFAFLSYISRLLEKIESGQTDPKINLSALVARREVALWIQVMGYDFK